MSRPTETWTDDGRYIVGNGAYGFGFTDDDGIRVEIRFRTALGCKLWLRTAAGNKTLDWADEVLANLERGISFTKIK